MAVTAAIVAAPSRTVCGSWCLPAKTAGAGLISAANAAIAGTPANAILVVAAVRVWALRTWVMAGFAASR